MQVTERRKQKIKKTMYLEKEDWAFLEKIKEEDPEITSLSQAMKTIIDAHRISLAMATSNEICHQCYFRVGPNNCEIWGFVEGIYDCDDFEERSN